MFIFFIVLGFLALGPQVVFSLPQSQPTATQPPNAFNNLFRLSLSNQLKECGWFNVTFKGNVNAKGSPFLPEALLILPVNSTPISVPVPETILSSPGLNVNFLPLKAGTTFLASLDDTSKEGLSLVSDIARVFPSDSQSCLAPEASSNSSAATRTAASSPFTLVGGSVTQCEDFTVTYTTPEAPNIRVFFPNSFSYSLRRTSASNGRATYKMAALRGLQTLLLYDSGNGVRRTSPILTVDGDSSSRQDCFPQFGNFNTPPATSTSAASSQGSKANSKSLIIGLSVGGGIIILVAIIMVLFILRERNRRGKNNSPLNPPPTYRDISSMEKPSRPSLPLPPLPPNYPTTIVYPEGYVKDPPYVSEKYSPTTSEHVIPGRTSIEWDTTSPKLQPKRVKGDSTTLNAMDIERMLDLAADSEDSKLATSPPRQSGPLYSSGPLADLSPTIPHRSLEAMPKPDSYFASESYAEMHGFGNGSVKFFESPRSTTSFNANISHSSEVPSSLGDDFVMLTRPPAAVPRSAVSSAMGSVIGVGAGVRSSIPFLVTAGSRSSMDSAIDKEMMTTNRF